MKGSTIAIVLGCVAVVGIAAYFLARRRASSYTRQGAGGSPSTYSGGVEGSTYHDGASPPAVADLPPSVADEAARSLKGF